MNVLEHRRPVLSETMSHFRALDLRHSNVANKYHRCPSSVDFSGRI